MSEEPILYTFRRCPYAMRARLALLYAGVCCVWREVDLKQKPQALLDASPKGTVPVLILPDGTVLEESCDIMMWALEQNDPDDWRAVDASEAADWLAANDGRFKAALNAYKYAESAEQAESARERACFQLDRMATALAHHAFLCGPKQCWVDVALFPFIRQFTEVDKGQFLAHQYPVVQQWLVQQSSGPLFLRAMSKYPVWHPEQPAVIGGYD